eukprot:TRINITY_DN20118_c0_g1_i1.p1 TRINITY_DN20118_c0_g1~~TRINITY_DN20118_c0_g1_i1.p1  ORF type:complete len:205 (-),score=42.87 TRINITY_DN20118_c0_g1_i1:50-664(-)
MTNKPIVVDCRGHLLGRLASYLAKELLNGQKIVCVRAEELNVSGSLFRNKYRFALWLRKHVNTNPRRGMVHYRAPSKILWRTIRGMVPHKTQRGAHALGRLKVFEGIPAPYDKIKRMVVPDALRVKRLYPNRSYTVLARLCSEFGWKYNAVVKRLEDKRKAVSAAYFAEKKKAAKANAEANAKVLSSVKARLGAEFQVLAETGF